jgi:hypothetical protein
MYPFIACQLVAARQVGFEEDARRSRTTASFRRRRPRRRPRLP